MDIQTDNNWNERDERIKAWLINLVKRHIGWLKDRINEQLSNGQIYGGELERANDVLVWLEKQGEPVSVYDQDDMITMFKEGAEWNGKQLLLRRTDR